MNSPISHVIILLPILLHLASATTAQPDFLAYECQDDYGNYTHKSPYEENLRSLLSSVNSNTQINYGFYNFSIGQDSDKVHGIALCRGDVSMPNCHKCINFATTKIIQVCPNQKNAIGWYEKCMIWYSNRNIFSGIPFHIYDMVIDSPHYNITIGKNNAPDLKSFNVTISSLLYKVAKEAASGDSRRKFATGEANVTGRSPANIYYALLQCTPNLEEFDCFNCLRIVISFTLSNCCYGKQGARVGVPSCNVRYENYLFYEPAIVLPPLPPPSSSPPTSSSPPPFSTRSLTGKTSKKSRIITFVLIPTVTSLILIILVGCYLTRRRNGLKKTGNEEEEEEDDGDEMKKVDSLQMDFSMIKAATGNFSNNNKLGKGGFGTVYMGRLSSGQVIAVKRLSKNSGQGDQEFKTEVLLVAKLQHRNLVRLHGFCLENDERLLIYEFLTNKSLDYLLFDPMKSMHLDWKKRCKIIGGIARGLLYLHEESRLLVVHRDLKASNVLLDADMNPKISDFGMARLFGPDQSHANTKKIAGTYGYMPPEYVLHGHFSIKSDVFSFGVLVLEIISGKRVSKFSQAENGESLLSFAWRKWLEGNALSLVDSTMSGVDTTEVMRCIRIGLLCVQESAAQRPIMSSVVLMLNSFSVTLPMPSRPAFLLDNDNMGTNAPLLEHNNPPLDTSINEASISELYPR